MLSLGTPARSGPRCCVPHLVRVAFLRHNNSRMAAQSNFGSDCAYEVGFIDADLQRTLSHSYAAHHDGQALQSGLA